MVRDISLFKKHRIQFIYLLEKEGRKGRKKQCESEKKDAQEFTESEKLMTE